MKRKEKLITLAAECGSISECPYCDFKLEKIPKRKSKCKSCKKPIYPRKEPLSNEYKLYREGDLFLLDELMAFSEGTWDDWYKYNKGILDARKELAVNWKVDETEVPIPDARWRKLNNDLVTSTQEQDWDKLNLTYSDMLYRVSIEDSSAKTPVNELVAGLMVTGYYKKNYLGEYGSNGPQTSRIALLTTDPDEVYDLIKDTQTAQSCCAMMNISLETIIKRYKAQLIRDNETREEIQQSNGEYKVTLEVDLEPIQKALKTEPKKNKSSNLWIIVIVLVVLGALALQG
ncbi:hypothetical protein EKG38_08510 [Shewanella canadensis]|uniref:Uncharacterized protein n=1 Tax=Shewanella canadensis TaxID=271096 RepID=A0A431WWK6_9GAMM|nr:hypothetical protein [Shewanella canadensis]RTR39818.1 hypothetical protein EKG38_08510 [Shewanella canadensis]